jgi:hypothetical protein
VANGLALGRVKNALYSQYFCTGSFTPHPSHFGPVEIRIGARLRSIVRHHRAREDEIPDTFSMIVAIDKTSLNIGA